MNFPKNFNKNDNVSMNLRMMFSNNGYFVVNLWFNNSCMKLFCK